MTQSNIEPNIERQFQLKELAEYIQGEYPDLTTFQVLQIAIGMQQNEILHSLVYGDDSENKRSIFDTLTDIHTAVFGRD